MKATLDIVKMILLQDEIVRRISGFSEFFETNLLKNSDNESFIYELLPVSENGREKICLLVFKDHLTLSYDYYERRYDFDASSADSILQEIITVIEKILREQLIAVTTYSTSLNATRVSDLYEPTEARKIRRRKNFRARSWAGTFDDNCCTE